MRSMRSKKDPPCNQSPPTENSAGSSRRRFLGQLAAISAGLTVTAPLARGLARSEEEEPKASSGKPLPASSLINATLRVNGQSYQLRIDPRVTLLDALRERLHLTGSKKGCDHGACGACTVHVDGRRVLSCLTLAVMAQGKEITTIEGIANGDELHPVQAAFIACDGFQCGFCTPGQVMSAVGCIKEGHTGSDGEIREFMSGNLCRCGAYPNIVDAIKAATPKMKGLVNR
ncbi:MAG: (2Fe-2S)-binding protein [Chthoniobacterales bacterium]